MGEVNPAVRRQTRRDLLGAQGERVAGRIEIDFAGRGVLGLDVNDEQAEVFAVRQHLGRDVEVHHPIAPARELPSIERPRSGGQ